MNRLETYDTFPVPVNEVWVDDGRNCRGLFLPSSVQTLADDIAADGLAIPVIVQRVEDSKLTIPPGYKYILVAGFRRFYAVTFFLKWTEIPANVRPMTDEEAEILNFTENLQRQDLNPLEEARAIHRRYPNGATLKEASKTFKRDTRWVHQRMRLLTLPESIQQKVAARILTLLDVEQLVKVPADKQLEAADELVAARSKVKSGRPLKTKYRRNFRYMRNKNEINRRLEELMELGFGGLVTRFGAWCAGYISDEEFDEDVKFAVEHPSASRSRDGLSYKTLKGYRRARKKRKS